MESINMENEFYLDITQQHIDECVADSSRHCAICKAAAEPDRKYTNWINIRPSSIIFDNSMYKCSEKLSDWQILLTQSKSYVQPIRIVFDTKNRTANIVKE